MEHDPISQKRMGPDIEECSPPRKRRKIPDAPNLALDENSNSQVFATPVDDTAQHEEIQNVTSGQFVSDSATAFMGKAGNAHFIGRSSVVKWDSQYVSKIFYKRVQLHLGNFSSRKEGEAAVEQHKKRPYLLEEKLKQSLQQKRFPKRTDLLKQRRSLETPIASGMFVNPSISRQKFQPKIESEASSGMLVKQDPEIRTIPVASGMSRQKSIDSGMNASSPKHVRVSMSVEKYDRKSSVDDNLIPTLLRSLPPAYQEYCAMFTDEGFDDMDVWGLLLKCTSCMQVQSKLNGLKNGFHAEVIAEKMRQIRDERKSTGNWIK